MCVVFSNKILQRYLTRCCRKAAPLLDRGSMNSNGEGVRPLCSPADREKLRMSQYKSEASCSTPEWRTSYRKRCKDRLTQSRERLVSRFRKIRTGTFPTSPTQGVGDEGGAGMDMENPVRMVTWSVEEVMKDEWEQMRAEDSRLPHLTRYRNRRVPLAGATGFGKSKRKSPYASSLCAEDEFESEDVNSVLTIIDELTQELILEEQALLAQYQEMQAEIDLTTMDSLSAGGSVICPICQKNFLFQDVRNIYCVCGVQINTIRDGLTLDSLQEQLELCVTQHSTVCCGRPVFSLECTLGIQNIIMNCTACEFMFVVL